MEDFINSISATPAIALGVAVLIFIVAVVLVIKRIIGFFITLLLLFFAIVSGYAILNHDIVRSYLNSLQNGEKPKEEDQNLKKTLINAYEELKEKIDSLIHKSESEETEKNNTNRQPVRNHRFNGNGR